MYEAAHSKICVGSNKSSESNVKVVLQQGSVLIPSLFAIVIQTISMVYCIGYLWELLYANDLVIAVEAFKSLDPFPVLEIKP